MTVNYACGKDNEVYKNDVKRHDAVITLSVGSKCTSDGDLGPEYWVEKNGLTTSKGRVRFKAKAGGTASFTVEEGQTVHVQCPGNGNGCDVEVVVNAVEKS